MAMPLTEVQLAYAAGIFDGEGCIRVNRQGKQPVVRIHVTNTDPRLTTTLKEWFGGYVWVESKQYMANAKIRYVWEASATSAARVLRAVLPYLFLKHEQAEIALAIQATKIRRNFVPVEIVAEREVLADRLRVLNKKGVA